MASASVTSAVSGRRAARSAWGSIVPSLATGSRVSCAPAAASAPSTEGCSIGDDTTCGRAAPGRFARQPRNRPPIARSFPSVPPDVKTISSAVAPMSAATSPLARSIAARAARPAPCVLEGLPGSSRSAAAMASVTSGAGGVVALWSR